MACVLRPTGVGVFTGKVGGQVTLEARGPEGAGAQVIVIAYESQVDNEAPIQFNVKHGDKRLIVSLEASKVCEVSLVEVCGDEENVMDTYQFNPKEPARTYFVRGE